MQNEGNYNKMQTNNGKKSPKKSPKNWTKGCQEELDYIKWKNSKIFTGSKYLTN